MNIALLQQIRDSNEPVPRGQLEQRWPRLEADLTELEQFGFRFSLHPYLGVSLAAHAERLCPDQIEWELETQLIGTRIAVWDRVASTNDLASRAGRSRTNEGLVVLAEQQTAGRGRRGRNWSAPARSSILASTLLFPAGAGSSLSWLTALGAVAVAEAVEPELERAVQIKWPNDVRLGGRKLAGVLVERRGAAAIVGIGINVNLAAAEFPAEVRDTATSLSVIANRSIDRSELARRLIQRLDHHYQQCVARKQQELLGSWRARLEPLGRSVRLSLAGGTVVGRLVEADLEAGLQVIDATGQTLRIASEEVLSFEDEAAGPDPGLSPDESIRFDSPGRRA